MPKAKPSAQSAEILIPEIDTRTAEIVIEGTTGLYFNRMSEKVKRELLIGGKRKTQAEKASQLKHNPREEFRASVYRDNDFDDDTCLYLPAVVIKNAMVTAAMVTPGVTGADIKRLVSVLGDRIPVYGVPTLRMDVVKQAGIQGAPDIRTRAYLPQWGARFLVEWISPNLTLPSIGALVHNAGKVSGIGDFRQEKGKGSFGKFAILPEGQDFRFKATKQEQAEALDDEPKLFDEETRDLMTMFDQSVSAERLDAAPLRAVR